VAHHGGVRPGGVSCLSSGNDNHNLYDDFGVAASPVTGLASITCSDDQYADNTSRARALRRERHLATASRSPRR